MTRNTDDSLTIEHVGLLPDLGDLPACVLPHGESGKGRPVFHSCCFCGLGDQGKLVPKLDEHAAALAPMPGPGTGRYRGTGPGDQREYPAILNEDGSLEIQTATPLSPPGGAIHGQLEIANQTGEITARETQREFDDQGHLLLQRFATYRRRARIQDLQIRETAPTSGCMKFNLSLMRQKPVYPIHIAPSVLESEGRREIGYSQAIEKLADAVLAHRQGAGRILIYCCGQIDYFSIFAMQEVFRLLGVRNLTGNAEHCLNAGAVHNEILTGQEGPFVTTDQGINGDNRFYLFNGWNGLITHPPAFNAILKRKDFDGFLIEVQETESAHALARKLDPDRVLLIKPRSDPHLALSVGHYLLKNFPEAIHRRFIDRFADSDSFDQFLQLAQSWRFAPERVAARIAAEPCYKDRLIKGIRAIAYRLALPDSVPINIPSVGLSQTSGVVAHCLWGNVLAMLGKYGLKPGGELAGGTLRLPGQINAESEVQGLSRKYFMGRIPIDQADDAASRMGLPQGAYQAVQLDQPRAALDYSDPADVPELFLCFGTHFAANMMGRERWLEKLESDSVRLIVVDPFPDDYGVENAELIIPSPPHPATPKLYQNGEWKLSLSIPHKQAPPESRSDTTIIYDLMASIVERLDADPELATRHPDLKPLLDSGYLRERFCAPGPESQGGLHRFDGEVSRAQLWDRVQDYMSGGCGPLYCRPEFADGRLIEWTDLLEKGAIIYGGVGSHRFTLDYDDSRCQPFADIFRNPRPFRFFVPEEQDLDMPDGIILNSGRSALSSDRTRIRFATATFNSGKSTPGLDMPDENPLFLSESLASRLAIKSGDWVRLKQRDGDASVELPALISDRVKGDTVYSSFHKCRAQLEDNRYLNSVTDHRPRCQYSAQTQVKATEICLERICRSERTRVLPMDTSSIDPRMELPLWAGQGTSLYVTDIIQETHDAYTFRFQGNPLCRFVYWPGQFCTLVLNIDGRKVVRSYTISSTPTRPYTLEITVKRVPGGVVSNWLPDNLAIGDRVEISGPKGKFCLTPGDIPHKLLLLGAGSGVTPMMAMSRWIFDISANVDIKFFNSVRSNTDIIFGTEIDMLTRRSRQFSPVVVTTTRGDHKSPSGLHGRISESMIEKICPDLHERHIFCCGPEGFMDAVKDLMDRMGFDSHNLHCESFGGLRTSAAGKHCPTVPTHAGADLGAQDHPIGPPSGEIAVEFAGSGVKVQTDGEWTLLDLAEANDIELDYGCRTGSCGECKCKVLKGEVESETDDGLEAEDREQGYVLACVARPKGDCTLDI